MPLVGMVMWVKMSTFVPHAFKRGEKKDSLNKKPKVLTHQNVLDLLMVAVANAGGQSRFANDHELNQALVSCTLKRRINPGPKILDALGLVREVTYREKS